MLMPEVTLVTDRYIHPPHHGYPQVMVMIMNEVITGLDNGLVPNML